MLRDIHFRLKLFNGDPKDIPRSRKGLLWLLEGLSQLNETLLEEYPGRFPLLYRSGVRYYFIEGREQWQDIPTTLETGGADCDVLTVYRVAELRHAGYPVKPYLQWRVMPNGKTLRFHALILWPDPDGVYRTSTEDPSRILGMGGNHPEAIRLRAYELRKLAARARVWRGRGNGSEPRGLFDSSGLRATDSAGNVIPSRLISYAELPSWG